MARASDPQLRELRFESCVPRQILGNVFILNCSSSLSCMNAYIAIDSGGYLCMNSLCALLAMLNLNIAQNVNIIYKKFSLY